MCFLSGRGAALVAWSIIALPLYSQGPAVAQHPWHAASGAPASHRGLAANPHVHLHRSKTMDLNAAAGQVYGMMPRQIQSVYGFDRVQNTGAGQTIAIIDAYDDPNIESDLGVFSAQFGLPACTAANGCFRKVYAGGAAPMPNASWAMEMALDVEWAHAIAPGAQILLVEAATAGALDLFQAIDVAVQSGASVVSMSWGFGEFRGDSYFDMHFNVQNVIFVASSGDSGHGVQYPAASEFVVGVGGTTLQLDENGNYVGETAWNGSGGGQSRVTPEPSFQMGAQNTQWRGVPDVSYNADPNTGYAVYDSLYSGNGGWIQVGGTSAGAPQWAGLFAAANSMRAGTNKQPLSVVDFDLYTIAVDYYADVISGSDGYCGAICAAGSGYDFVTGLGTPRAGQLLPALMALP